MPKIAKKAAPKENKKIAKESEQPRRKLTEIREDNLQQILDAAEDMFAEQGFRGTTVASIAEAVGLPKANVLYYFKTKEGLYKAVINRLLTIWMENMNEMTADMHPKDALRSYISTKVNQARENPNASRIFAADILHGAHFLRAPLEAELKDQFDRTCDVFRSWMDKKWIDQANPEHLMFMLWSTTQAYADHGLQMGILMKKECLDDEDYAQGIELLTQIILKGCGVE
ncbi:TetR/AcrR family transcriptional regulator [Psychromonas algicola]|uniref:TetR/AcrR family transcriptional regulator n=1 Tax=Psychromonas algicola TaxID=2555642 RepID=UPI001ABADA08|nr:TetR/AcrR family transcriptional regulator [Psychromonas sp. RZ5]